MKSYHELGSRKTNTYEKSWYLSECLINICWYDLSLSMIFTNLNTLSTSLNYFSSSCCSGNASWHVAQIMLNLMIFLLGFLPHAYILFPSVSCKEMCFNVFYNLLQLLASLHAISFYCNSLFILKQTNSSSYFEPK